MEISLPPLELRLRHLTLALPLSYIFPDFESEANDIERCTEEFWHGVKELHQVCRSAFSSCDIQCLVSMGLMMQAVMFFLAMVTLLLQFCEVS